MTQCFIDIETFSRADLRRTGAYRYAEDPSTQLLLVSYAFGAAGEVQTWTPCLGEEMPDDLAAAFTDPAQTFIAHNAAFERVLLGQLLDEKLRAPSRWRCTMALAYSLALPGSLDELCDVLGVADDKAKLKDGKRLVMKFCTPNRQGDQVKATDEMDAWMRFVEYSRLDVVANQEIAKRMGRWALPEHEQKLWELDQQINDTGLPVDLELVDAALAVRALDEERGIARSKELTNLDNPNSRAQLLQYLQDSGLAIADLTKASVSEALRSEDLDPEIREVLELRRGLSKTSIKKFQALRDAVCADGRLRGTLQYAGAGRTWRWSGRLFQPQNLARPTLSDADIPVAIEAVKTHDEKCVRTMFSDTAGVLSSLIRPAIAAPAGQTLVSCDYSSIETVMLAWAARSPYLLELYASGRDPYIDFFSKRFGVPYDDVTKKQRSWAKPAVLGCFAADTQVLTQRGWVAITQVAITDKLWDGVEWVSHEGVIDQGVKPTQKWLGVTATSDHKIYTGENQWSPVAACSKSLHLSLKALLSATLPSSGIASANAGDAHTTSHSVAAAARRNPPEPTSMQAGRRDVRSAQNARPEEPNQNGLKSYPTRRFARLGRLVTQLCLTGAPTPKTAPIDIMAREESQSTPTGSTAQFSYVGWPASPGTATSVLSWIASITTARTPRGTAAWPPESNNAATPAQRAESATLGLSIRFENSVGALLQRIGMILQCDASLIKARLQKMLFGISDARAVRTFDILNAGPRSRFTIRTDCGPVIAHNCGYMLGAKGLVAYAQGYGVPLTEEEAQAAVDTYRREYDDIPQFWWDLDRAARACINGRSEESVGPFKFVMDGPFMQILLPSGRALSYLQPRIEERETPWGEMKPQITYLGRDTGKKMQRISTHPGKLCENIVQAIARDVLAFGLVWAASSGSRIIGHVHDEIIVQCPQEAGKEELSKLTHLMGLRPEWCDDAPISAAGWVGDYYRKD